MDSGSVKRKRNLFGKKTMMFPLITKMDFKYFDKLREECYVHNLKIVEKTEVFLIKNINGKGSKNIGVVVIFYFIHGSAQVCFLFDKNITSGISKHIKNTYTYAEDIVRTIINYLHSKNIVRVETHAFSGEKNLKRILIKSGFDKEGTLRKFHFRNGKLYDLIVYSNIRGNQK